jgi:hypothetical protein
MSAKGQKWTLQRYTLWDVPMTRLTTMAAIPASTALAIGDFSISAIGLNACDQTAMMHKAGQIKIREDKTPCLSERSLFPIRSYLLAATFVVFFAVKTTCVSFLALLVCCT